MLKRIAEWLKKSEPAKPTSVEMKPTFTLSAVVTRADGTVEDLGVIARSEE